MLSPIPNAIVQGLTPDIFWTHKAALLSASREDLSESVCSLVSKSTSVAAATNEISIRKVEGRVALAVSPPVPLDTHRTYVLLGPTDSSISSIPKVHEISTSLANVEGSTKRKDVLRDHILPQVDSIPLNSDTKITVVFNETNEEYGIATTLLLLQRMFTDTTEARSTYSGLFMREFLSFPMFSYRLLDVQATKHSLRLRLEWIIASRPKTNPSRATLKRLNEYFMSPRHPPMSSSLPG